MSLNVAFEFPISNSLHLKAGFVREKKSSKSLQCEHDLKLIFSNPACGIITIIPLFKSNYKTHTFSINFVITCINLYFMKINIIILSSWHKILWYQYFIYNTLVSYFAYSRLIWKVGEMHLVDLEPKKRL